MYYHPFSDAMVKAINEGAYLVLATRLDLPSGVVRAHTGVGPLVIDGETYLGVGQHGSVEGIGEQTDTSPSQLTLKLSGFDKGLVGEVLNQKTRGHAGRVMLAALGEDGLPLRAELLFAGVISASGVSSGEENAVSLTLANRFERWSVGLPNRFSDASFSQRKGGDRFFRYVAQMADRAIYWGAKKDAPPFNYQG